ncbi:SDR family oxidoreductase [Orrella daihaiensis]|uniref:SDR family oxidoreductase n=1 Tax=Orrella daihaiensis TaxID=2782176 RepID=A0ABY4AHX5_9BURK|nr:SDR family oxidoreductase [Orrella daihaiensis]UOD49890.1 SDR family oxidoreductase [Orrella daihaiensis]
MSESTLPHVALVTGGAKRLGRQIALDLARAGWDVAIHYSSSRKEAEHTAAEIQNLGRRTCLIAADLANQVDVNRVIGQCASTLGEPSCLVNNASLFEYDNASSFTYEQLQRHMAINVAAAISLTHALHQLRVESRYAFPQPAVAINLLDQKLINPNPDFLSYTLSKAALLEATRLLAQALAPQTRVVGLGPGITLVSGDQTDESFVQAHQQTPLGRSSTPSDIGAAVVYLASAHAITGTTLYVDGGQHLQPSDRDVMFLTG